METFNFSVPQDITVGKGSLSKLPEIAKKLGGKHALIISGPHLEKMGLVKKAADYLASVDIKADTFTDIEANPSVTTVEKATAKYLESGADFIVAFGGGSPMDVAKAVGVVAKYGGSVTDYEGAHKVPGPIVPLIAIPTTAGTGSEVTAFSVITDHSRNYKLTVFSYEILPKYAILDAELITTAPASVAAAFCARATCGHVASITGSPRASTERRTAGVTPWLRMMMAPCVACSGSLTASTPRASRFATTWGLWMSGPNVNALPSPSLAFRARSRARCTP